MTEQNSVGEIRLSDNGITFESGEFVWKAAAFDKGKIEFSPWKNVNNSFVCTKMSEDAWKAVLIYPRSKSEPEKITYLLQRFQ
ncbi:MAG: hypothetical protein R3281_14350 [Balneolaceae bacterium]|nr:hypothetical protein [Balneolaceae bacterium]